MKRHHLFPLRLIACFCGALLAIACFAAADPAKTSPPAATNSAPQVVVIPKSVFDLTSPPVKDPFFPMTVRQPISAPTSTNSASSVSISSFQLKGLSGASNQRLALINNRTLAEGESSEVTTPAGKVKIRCLHIRDTSVVIRVADQPDPIELKLPTDREMIKYQSPGGAGGQ